MTKNISSRQPKDFFLDQLNKYPLEDLQMRLLTNKAAASVFAKNLQKCTYEAFEEKHQKIIDSVVHLDPIILKTYITFFKGKESSSEKLNHVLCQAACFGFQDSAALLLKNGADINAISEGSDYAPLHLSIIANQAEMALWLLEQGASFSLKSKRGNSPLCLACQYGREGLVNLFLEKVTDTHEKSAALFVAVVNNYLSIVEKLLKNKADPNQLNEDGVSSFIIGCFEGYLDSVSLMCNYGADINQQDQDSQSSALHLATQKDNCQLIKLLLNKGADINIPDGKGRTPLIDALLLGQLKAANIFIRKGADIHTPTAEGMTALHLCAKLGFSKLIPLLVNRGGSITQKTKSLATPLHLAVQSGNLASVKLLCTSSLLKEKDMKGNTPLHYAAFKGFDEIFSFLKKEGSDPEVENNEGVTPSQLLIAKQLIEKLPIKIEKDAEARSSKLLKACKQGNALQILEFLGKGADTVD